MKPTSQIVKTRAQHAATKRAAATEKAQEAEVSAVEGMNLGATTLIPRMQKAQNIQRQSK